MSFVGWCPPLAVGSRTGSPTGPPPPPTPPPSPPPPWTAPGSLRPCSVSSQPRCVSPKNREREQEPKIAGEGGQWWRRLQLARSSRHPPKTYVLPEMERLELEKRLLSCYTGGIQSRHASVPVMRCTSRAFRARIAGILRAVIRQTIESRPIRKQSSGSSGFGGVGGVAVKKFGEYTAYGGEYGFSGVWEFDQRMLRCRVEVQAMSSEFN